MATANIELSLPSPKNRYQEWMLQSAIVKKVCDRSADFRRSNNHFSDDNAVLHREHEKYPEKYVSIRYSEQLHMRRLRLSR